jgi:hypothetical protein
VTFIDNHCPGTTSIDDGDDGLTIGGAAPGAAN